MFSYGIKKGFSKLKKFKHPLQVQTLLKIRKSFTLFYKRTLPFIFCKNGSLTVETALVLPIFIFAILGILSMGQMVMVEEEISRGVAECARYYARQENPQLGLVFVRTTFEKYVDTNYLNRSCLKKGLNGISFFGTKYDEETGEVNIKTSFALSVNLPLISRLETKLSQQKRQKVFNGYRENEYDDSSYVYVTVNQGVYHNNRECSHLQLSVSQVLDIKKYLSGDTSYSPCSHCAKNVGTKVEILYITKEGDRFHTSLECSGLKRTVKRVKKSQVGGLGLCQRCGKTSGKEGT